MSKIHNHYVPAYYLSGFINPATQKIYMYFKSSKKVVPTTVQSAANELHYWSDDIETYLANEVENPANLVIEKIRNFQSITIQDKWQVARYIVSMLKRVPDGRERILSNAPEVLKQMMEKMKIDLEEAKTANPSEGSRIDKLLEQVDNPPPDFYEKIPKEAWEQVLSPELTIESVGKIHEMRWVFFKSQLDRDFLTSDNPVVYTRANGIRPPAGELFFPISRNITLWASWNMEWVEGKYYPAQRNIIDLFNYWIVYSATDYIFYSGHKNWIQALIKKVTRHSQRK